jgi:hypothetical protein
VSCPQQQQPAANLCLSLAWLSMAAQSAACPDYNSPARFVPPGGIGMPGTWLHGSGISFEKACACNPNGWPNSPKVAPGDQANHCCDLAPGPPPPSDPHLEKGRCSFLYETIEGGPQDDERWRTGANVGCFAYTAGAEIAFVFEPLLY